ncbi:MAG TPA: ROK family protein [Solirubrobacterales bacterium]|nr:ROK family protein [Solirubrobacterales bacterium]
MSARGGIDLGGTKIQGAIVDSNHEVMGEARRPTPREGGPEDIAKEIAGVLRDAAENAGVKPDELAGIGVGSPGDADEKTGVVSGARNLPGWEGSFPLADALSKDLGAPVRVGNDVQVAVEAEYHLGAGKPYRSLVGVFWGTGVGGGLVLDGKPWLGRGAAGEIGHVVVKRGGPRCSAGHPGCMEAYAGRGMMEEKARLEVARGRKTKLFDLMQEHGRDRLSSGIWERALHHEDKLAQELMIRAEKALAAGIASIVNLLDPECVILGGGMGIRFADRYLHKIEHRMAEYLFDPEDPPAFAVAALGDLGGAIGAALLVERQAA